MPRTTLPILGDAAASIDRLKRVARRQQRAQDLLPPECPRRTLMQCQDEVAKTAGFQHWHHALRCLASPPVLDVMPKGLVGIDRWPSSPHRSFLNTLKPMDQSRLLTALASPANLVVIDGRPGDGQKFMLFEMLHGFNMERLKTYVWIESHHAPTLAALWPKVGVLDQRMHPDPDHLVSTLLRSGPDVVLMGNLNSPTVWNAALRLLDHGVQVLGYTNAPGPWPQERQHPRLVRIPQGRAHPLGGWSNVVHR